MAKKKLKESDPRRYTLPMVREAIEEAGYTNEQLTLVLSEYDNGQFPSNGIDDEGKRKIMDRIAEMDTKQARLVNVERKDLGSEVTTEAMTKAIFGEDRKQKQGIMRRMGNSVANIPRRVLDFPAKVLDFFYDHKGIKRTALTVLITSSILLPTAGRWIAYNVKYIDAVNAIELTQGENKMRSEFFNYFYNAEALPRTTALANNYFLVAKEAGLTTDEAKDLLRTIRPSFDSKRLKINLASKYIKFLKENEISIEEGISILRFQTRENVNDAINLIKQAKKDGIILR